MSAEAWLEELLPTKWSRRFALATIAIAASAFGLPSLLPASYLPALPEQLFLLRVLLLLSSGLIGTLAVLVSVRRHMLELTHQPSKWSVRDAVATVAVLAGLGALSVLVPSSYLPAPPERAFVLGIALLVLALAATFVILSHAVRNARKIEKQVNRSFWEAGP